MLDTRDTRRATLRKQYYFDCDCKKCQDDDETDKSGIKCSDDCQDGFVPVSNMTCQDCGAKHDISKKENYLQLANEFMDLVIKNKHGHPEPEEQVNRTKTFKRIMHLNDKTLFDEKFFY